jgi:pimeloyl-ACP methyl ester carboxylesterase
VLTGAPLVRLKAVPKPKLGYRIVRRLAALGLVSKGVLESRRKKYGSPDYLAANGVMRDILVRTVAEDYSADLAAIDVPVRMVWGALDDQAPADAGLAASELTAGATFRSVPGAGHLLVGELEAAVRAELLTLIGDLK